MRAAPIISLLLLLRLVASGQDTLVVGTITYRAGDALYLSIGRAAGVRDSMIVPVVSRGDTVGLLKVFGTSSKSSVCSIVRANRELIIGDTVFALVHVPAVAKPAVQQRSDTLRQVSSASVISGPVKNREPISMKGRMNFQYFRTTWFGTGLTYTQPALSLDLHAGMNALPLAFDVYGSVRSRTIGQQILFGANRANESRIYRMTLQYDDTTNRVTLGRFLAPAAPSAGLVDGVMIAHSWQNISIGSAFGFDPTMTPGALSFGTDASKFILFGSYAPERYWHSVLNLGYSRSYLHGILNRELLSSGLTVVPSARVYLTASGDFDLRQPSGGAFIGKPQLSSLYANASFRASDIFSLGLGISAWRPVYFFNTIMALPDSLIDTELRTNPSVTATLYPLRGVVLYDTYSPRSGGGPGREYLNFTSVSIANLPADNMSLNGTWNVNGASFVVSRGYSLSLRWMPGPPGEAGLR